MSPPPVASPSSPSFPSGGTAAPAAPAPAPGAAPATTVTPPALAAPGTAAPAQGTPPAPALRAGKTFASALAQEKKARGLEAQLTERQKALDAKEAEMKALDTLRQTDPLAYLEKVGLSYDKLTDMILTGKPAAPVVDPALKAELDGVKAKLGELDKTREEAEKALQAERSRQQVAAYFEAGEKEVREAGDTFALLLGYAPEGLPNGLELAKKYAATYAQRNGEVLPFKVAAEHVQKALEANRRAFLPPEPEAGTMQSGSPKAAPTGTSSGPAVPPRTITSQAVGHSRAVNPADLSEAQRRELAADLLRRRWSGQA